MTTYMPAEETQYSPEALVSISPQRADQWNVDLFCTDDRINGAIYRDEEIFKREMNSIFYKYWVYIGHESEVKKPGAYKTTFIGLQPVIFHRAKRDGSLHVFLNRCRHRGASLCNEKSGEVTNFTCPYHGWAYDGHGRLVGVPFKDDYDPAAIEHLDLIQAPRVASYKGLVFASLSPTGPSLEEHLGHARPYLDTILEQDVEVTSGRQQYESGANWKLQLENTVDNYHVRTTHKVFNKLFKERSGQPFVASPDYGWARDLGNGHGVMGFADKPVKGIMEMFPFNLTIFPNLAFVGIQIRLIRPIAPRNAVVELYPLRLVGSSDEQHSTKLRIHEDMFGPAGFATPDDVEVALRRVSDGLDAIAEDDWAYVGKGLANEVVDDDGIRHGGVSDETAVRALYREWRRAMAAGARAQAAAG